MGNQKIDFNHIKTYTITENNVVGVNDSLTLRTLDNASPTDLNAVYVASNGSDAGADAAAGTGVATSPVLTVAKAIAVTKAQPARNTIHFIRNGYVGDMIYTVSTHQNSLVSSTIFQSELGEYVTINMTFPPASLPGPADIAQIEGSALKFNGIKFIVNTITVPSVISWGMVENASSIAWCDLIFDGTYGGSTGIFYGFAIQCTTFKNNKIIMNANFGSCMTSVTNVTNNVFINNATHLSTLLNACVQLATVVEHNSFYEFAQITADSDCTFKYNIVNGTSILGTHSNFYEFDETKVKYCLFTETKLYNSNIIDNTIELISIDSTNQTGIDPLFIDPLNSDLRLSDQRRIAPGSTKHFIFTSKAVYNVGLDQIPSDETKDLGAYDFSYAVASDLWDSIVFENEDWNSDYDIIHELINYQGFNDIRGNFRRSFDGNWAKRTINLKMEGMTYYGTRESYDLLDLLQFEGAKRYYPFGTDGIFSSSGSLTINADLEFDTILDSISNLRRNAYRGFVCGISSGASSYELQISENSSGGLVLRDHRGNQSGIPDGSYLIECLYLPIEIDMSSFTQNWTNWDPQANPLYPDYDLTSTDNYENVENTEPQSWEGHLRVLILKETEEDE